jgi:uncharacterized protein
MITSGSHPPPCTLSWPTIRDYVTLVERVFLLEEVSPWFSNHMELRRQASFREDQIRFSHFRDKDGVEVDIVLEASAHLVAGVEIKAGSQQ